MIYAHDDLAVATTTASDLHQHNENVDYLEYVPASACDHYLQDNSNLANYLKFARNVVSSSESAYVTKERIANICWRRIYKNLHSLAEINPYYINWDKNSDITWLYGPKFDRSFADTVSNTNQEYALTEDNLNMKLNCEEEDDGYYSSSSESSEVSSISFNDVEERDDDVSSVDSGYMGDYQCTSSIPSELSLRKNSVASTASSSTYYDEDNNDYMSLKSILKKDAEAYYKSMKMMKRRKDKKVSFNFIVNTREIVNGISFDYDFLDQGCL
ncbi:predicted protein [Scheffersomyces stipitis CBS 6054]|uniref:Nitrogen regulatory protein areA GATA-like domain-containing protein n=1 Tax=Scheffersomyces stipitis (strain ATCC 58785 / CBS 6054 / NBRC 10063 / NRRL Y-11545) TaxID=322104 RepID=A3GH87_PICST|nr:predicted protein [Scheffersomyces stipitis CBS 6054]EAZ63012.2 predicted protein [Scheffersomyces stipitis CBS 6054]KAG2735124.1 hypothetical protein G9P44_001338 [Scheffersomyces stipitis]